MLLVVQKYWEVMPLRKGEAQCPIERRIAMSEVKRSVEEIARELVESNAFIYAQEFNKDDMVLMVAVAIQKERSERDTLEQELEMLREQIKSVPFGNNYEANRYNTDDEVVIHLWDVNGGGSYDVRIKK